MSRLSVIVPVYNVGFLINRCIESLINQSYKDIEIIIINDGSTDNSFDYIKPYLKNPKIKYICNPSNQGLGYSRNVGLREATGEFIAFVDSDDWVDLDLYKLMINSIDESHSDIAICGIKNEYDNFSSSQNRYDYLCPNQISSKKALSLLSRCENNNYVISPVVWNKIYRKELILSHCIQFLKDSYWEDDIFSFQVFVWAKTVNIVPDVYYHYYQREKSITNDFSKKHIDDLLNSFKQLDVFINSIPSINLNFEFNSYFDRAIISLLQMLFKNEPSVKNQKKYIVYLYEQFVKSFSISEAILYLDINRIKKLFI